MMWLLLIIAVVAIMYFKSQINEGSKSASSTSSATTTVQNMWSEFEQSTMKRVNESWGAYLQRARQENQASQVLAGDHALDSLLHNFFWCVYDLSKFATDCHGILTIQNKDDRYSIQASAHLSIDELSKYQVLNRAMTESFFIDTPGIRLSFSDSKLDIDHDESFPWVSTDHTRMIPTMDYYVTGMSFSVTNISSLSQSGLLSGWLKTPKDLLEYEAKEHLKYGLVYTIDGSRDDVVKMDFTSHYTEPTVE